MKWLQDGELGVTDAIFWCIFTWSPWMPLICLSMSDNQSVKSRIRTPFSYWGAFHCSPMDRVGGHEYQKGYDLYFTWTWILLEQLNYVTLLISLLSNLWSILSRNCLLARPYLLWDAQCTFSCLWMKSTPWIMWISVWTNQYLFWVNQYSSANPYLYINLWPNQDILSCMKIEMYTSGSTYIWVT